MPNSIGNQVGKNSGEIANSVMLALSTARGWHKDQWTMWEWRMRWQFFWEQGLAFTKPGGMIWHCGSKNSKLFTTSKMQLQIDAVRNFWSEQTKKILDSLKLEFAHSIIRNILKGAGSQIVWVNWRRNQDRKVVTCLTQRQVDGLPLPFPIPFYSQLRPFPQPQIWVDHHDPSLI